MQTIAIINEIQRQRVRDIVQEVQARAIALRMLLNTKTVESNLSMQLVISALNPLQVSLEMAKLKLQDYKDQETWEFCYIIGTSTLIAGYAFLGQDIPHLRKELAESMVGIQKRMLNQAARRLLESTGEFPWEQVPRLISTEGIEDLLALYQLAPSQTVTLNQEKSVTVRSAKRESDQAIPKTAEPEQGPRYASKEYYRLNGWPTCSLCHNNVKNLERSCPHCHAIFSNP